MDYSWLEDYILSKKAVVKDYKVEWDAVRFMINNKMFGMMGDMYGEPILTLKLEPDFSQFLRTQYEGDIIPGYYMNKIHWSTIKLSCDSVTRDVVEDMIDQSYQLFLKSQPKKIQKEIEEM